ncbi:AsmA family protein [Pararhodonellum marinum]|uniref:AsmA family protein n=1 Tax=Pararhodonellum marinum TaxID=2755358 RepID=UPI0018905569|nr:AsmA-like C-terminal region-containing protein [Pararhodonellum marinum]
MDRKKRIQFLKISGIFLLFLLVSMWVFPMLFKDTVNKKVVDYVNDQVTSEVSFENINLSFFRHFPSLTVSLDDILIKSAAEFPQDTLLYAKEMALGVKLFSLFGEKIIISQFFLNEADINILRDSRGNANFDIFKVSEDRPQVDPEVDKEDLELDIQRIVIKDSHFLYFDTSIDFACTAGNFNYKGHGNLKEKLFDLKSNIDIIDFGLEYDQVKYLERKQIKANLVTKIDTESTALTFERNKLVINELPVDFIGKLEFITGGYDMNFVLESVNANFKDILSLIPEEFYPWLGSTRVGGKGEVRASLQGLFVAEGELMPNLVMNLRVNDGSLAHSGAPSPIDKLNLNLDIIIPELEIDAIQIDLDSLFFNLSKGYFQGSFHLEGLEDIKLRGDLQANLDLELLDKALGVNPYTVQGLWDLELHFDGIYAERRDPKSFRVPKYKVVSIPKFDLQSHLKDGLFQFTGLPEPITDIQFDLQAGTRDSLYQNIGISIENIQLKVLDDWARGYLKAGNLGGESISADFSTHFDLSHLERFYPLDSGMDLKGNLDIKLQAEGSYLPEQKKFPLVQSQLNLTDGYIKTPYFEEPIASISLVADIENQEGTFTDLKFDLQPIRFNFADHPFVLEANLENLEDIKYAVSSKGRLDLGKLYRVFRVEGQDIDGHILTDFNLQGLQSDALSGNYARLNNQGTIDIEKIRLISDYLPHPLKINAGKFHFEQEKLIWDAFEASYANSPVQAKGYLENFLGYLSDNEPLSGNLEFSSSSISLNELMFYGEDQAVTLDTVGVVAGVIMVPENLSLKLSALVDTLTFDSLVLNQFKGVLTLKNGEMIMDDSGFEIIGATVAMKAQYQAQNPLTANFAYAVKANNFDIQRAYAEIPIFRELVSAAAYVQGTASLDYQLAGRLDANMHPVLPSIKGEGVLGLDDVRVRGFRLMNTIANRTDNNNLRDPDLSDVQIRSSISNNLITIERTRMRIAGFRPRFEGQVSLDGDMNIAFRLGLPPFGIFGIPIKITGNQEDYQMAVGRPSEADELEEIIDELSEEELEEWNRLQEETEKEEVNTEESGIENPV